MLINSLQSLKIKFKVKHFVFLGLFVHMFCFSDNVFSQEKLFTVVLDAGHGGKDPGKIGYKNYNEKDIALDIVLLVGKMLSRESNVKVIYTRKKDVFVDLWERGRIANRADADLFVSVHCNAHNSQASGAETWVLGLHGNKRNFEVAKAENEVILLEDNYQERYKGFNPNSPESMIGLTLEQEENLDESLVLASSIQSAFKNALKRKDRGVKQAGFVVLHQTYMPSVLIETGFLTNKREGAYLGSRKGKSDMSSAISKAISNYIKGVRLNTVSSVRTKNYGSKKNLSNSNGCYFKIQIASGKFKVDTASKNFKGLKNVSCVAVGDFYKYYLGNTKSYDDAKLLLVKAKKSGYKSSFITAFRGNKRISLSEAIK